MTMSFCLLHPMAKEHNSESVFAIFWYSNFLVSNKRKTGKGRRELVACRAAGKVFTTGGHWSCMIVVATRTRSSQSPTLDRPYRRCSLSRNVALIGWIEPSKDVVHLCASRKSLPNTEPPLWRLLHQRQCKSVLVLKIAARSVMCI